MRPYLVQDTTRVTIVEAIHPPVKAGVMLPTIASMGIGVMTHALLRSATGVNEQFPGRDVNPLDTLPMTARRLTLILPLPALRNCKT